MSSSEAVVRSRSRELSRSWAQMFERESLVSNLSAGVVVATIAIPLNLALAVACGLPPSAGLIGGAIGGLIGALFGGARLNITGPEVALAPLTAVIVMAHGVSGLMAAMALAGLVQIGLGLSGIGGVVRLLPRPVIGGFLAAVGIMVFDTQLPHLLGVHDGRSVLALAGGITDEILTHGTAVGVGLAVMVVLVVLPRLAPKVPAPIVGLSLAMLGVYFLDLPVERVTRIEGDALTFALPDVSRIDWLAIAPSAIALALLASLDSLLCAVSVDARMGGERHDPDQELVAQGVANIACSCVGGMPVAAAVVRSMAAIGARGTTRLCGVVQSIVLLLVLSLCGGYLDAIPLAALSGVLLVVGARLVDLRELANLAKVRRAEAFVFVATAIAIVLTGFVEGLLIGLVLTLLQLARAHALSLDVRASEPSDAVARVELAGPLVFASQQTALSRLEEATKRARAVVLDLDGVTQWDSSGLAALRVAVEGYARAGGSVEIDGYGPIPASALATELGANVRVRTLSPGAAAPAPHGAPTVPA